MRLAPRTFLTEALLWFGAGGGALAWTVQLVLGSESEETRCAPAGMRWGFDARTFAVSVTAAAAAITLAALAVSLFVLREVRRSGGDRRGRILFVAASGVLTDAVFLALILLGGIGAATLESCVQG
jgi:divalent metal cation (Fe/Co/Zn/Cd) transporter